MAVFTPHLSPLPPAYAEAIAGKQGEKKQIQWRAGDLEKQFSKTLLISLYERERQE
jgi:hypothetical protein